MCRGAEALVERFANAFVDLDTPAALHTIAAQQQMETKAHAT